jgi:hypothetical protein
MITGTIVMRWKPNYGWQVFDWIPASFTIDKPSIKVIYNAGGKASLIRITATFKTKLRVRQFSKAPHHYIHWQPQQEERMAA